MPDNPFHPLTDAPKSNEAPTQSVSTNREAYNVVTDTVTGVNLRWSDNKFQAIFVLVSVVLFSLPGAIIAFLNPQWKLPWYGGALIGALAGLVLGTFASGIFLMVYRAAKHLKGKHD